MAPISTSIFAAELARQVVAYQSRQRSGRPRNTRSDPIPHFGDRGPLKPSIRGKLRKDVKKIKKNMNKDMAHHTHRRRDVVELGPSAENVQSVDAMTANDQASIELAMAGFRYYNPAVPGTLTTAAAGTGTYQRDVHCTSFWTQTVVRNNYQIPCWLTLYCVTNKADTDITCGTSMLNGLTDQGNPGSNSPLVYPTDSDQFNDMYNIVKSRKVFMEPGRQISMSYAKNDFWYDPSLNDSHGLNFQKRWGAAQWLYIIEGCLGHDSAGTAQEVGTCQASLDVLIDRTWKFDYDAGVNLNDITVDQNSAAFTNVGIVSNKAVADNQSFSTT